MTDYQSKRRPRNWRSFEGSLTERASIALSRLEDITRLVSEWVWETDSEGRFTYVSDRIMEVLGYHQMQLVDKQFLDIGHFKNLKGGKTEPNWQKPFRHLEFVAKTKSGEERIFHVSGLPIFNPETWKFDGVCGISEDITDRIRREEALKTALADVQLANRAKTNFLSNMSHELRTPLNAIIGFSDAMMTNALGDMDGEQIKTFAGHIKHAGDQLLELIDEILEVAAMEEGDINLREEPVDIGAVFDAVNIILTHRATEAGVSLRFKIADHLPFLIADSIRLKQIILNLVSNGVRFNKKGGTVKCEAKVDFHNAIRITIEDTGVGMSFDETSLALVPLSNNDSPFDNTNSGKGLGIPLTKGLVEAHGGTMEIESEKDKGTKVTIQFPPSRTQSVDTVG